MNDLTLKKVDCKNCGAGLVFEPSTQMSECNFCGSQFEIETAKEEKIYIPEGILPFKIQQDEYNSQVLSWLSEGDYTPDDILNSSIFDSVVGSYLPMRFYKGRYSGNWSASSGYNRIEEYITRDSQGKAVRKTRTVTDWRPSNGQMAGSYAVLGFAGLGKGISSDIANYAEGTNFKRGDVKSFDPQYLSGFNMIEYTLDSIDCWEQRAESQVNSIARSDAKKRVPGDKHKDFICDVVYDEESNIGVLVPFWITHYQYKGKSFHVYMDGTSVSRIQGERPVDEKRKKEAKKKFRKGHISLISTIIIGMALSGNTDEETLQAILGIALVVTGILYFVGWRQKKKLIQQSKQRRQEILKNLKG